MWALGLLSITGFITGVGVVGRAGDCSLAGRGGARVFIVTSGLPSGQGWMSCESMGALLIFGSVALAVVTVRPFLTLRNVSSPAIRSTTSGRLAETTIATSQTTTKKAVGAEPGPIRLSGPPITIRGDDGYRLRVPLDAQPDREWCDLFEASFEGPVTFEESAIVIGAGENPVDRLTNLKAAVEKANEARSTAIERAREGRMTDFQEQQKVQAAAQAWWEQEGKDGRGSSNGATTDPIALDQSQGEVLLRLPLDDAWDAVELAASRVGQVLEFRRATSSMLIRTRYDLQRVKLRVSIVPHREGSLVKISWTSDDGSSRGGTHKGLDEFVAALNEFVSDSDLFDQRDG